MDKIELTLNDVFLVRIELYQTGPELSTTIVGKITGQLLDAAIISPMELFAQLVDWSNQYK